MPRSNRRCAVSLHDVSKCTVPRRCSAASWAVAEGAIAAANVAATMAASDDLIMVASLAFVVGETRPVKISWSLANARRRGNLAYVIGDNGARELSLRARSGTARLVHIAKAAHDSSLHPAPNG